MTLVETMVTLAVAAILLTAAVPPMQGFIVRNQMSTEVNTLVGALYLARSEAVKRLQNVVVCPTTDSVNCAPATDWTPGWMVFSDPNNNGVVYIAMYALSYGMSVSSSPVRSAPIYLGYMQLNGF